MFATSSRIIERYQIKSCPTWFSSKLNGKLLEGIHGFRQGHGKSYFRVYLLLEWYLSQDNLARPATRHSTQTRDWHWHCHTTMHMLTMESNVSPDILDDLQAYMEYQESREWSHFAATGPPHDLLGHYIPEIWKFRGYYVFVAPPPHANACTGHNFVTNNQSNSYAP